MVPEEETNDWNLTSLERKSRLLKKVSADLTANDLAAVVVVVGGLKRLTQTSSSSPPAVLFQSVVALAKLVDLVTSRCWLGQRWGR